MNFSDVFNPNIFFEKFLKRSKFFVEFLMLMAQSMMEFLSWLKILYAPNDFASCFLIFFIK